MIGFEKMEVCIIDINDRVKVSHPKVQIHIIIDGYVRQIESIGRTKKRKTKSAYHMRRKIILGLLDTIEVSPSHSMQTQDNR